MCDIKLVALLSLLYVGKVRLRLKKPHNRLILRNPVEICQCSLIPICHHNYCAVQSPEHVSAYRCLLISCLTVFLVTFNVRLLVPWDEVPLLCLFLMSFARKEIKSLG